MLKKKKKKMTQKKCKRCGKIIINNYEKWVEENKYITEIMCPYCGFIENSDERNT